VASAEGMRFASNQKAAKKSNTMLRCDCSMPKSIHSRMYANQSSVVLQFSRLQMQAYSPARIRDGRVMSRG